MTHPIPHAVRLAEEIARQLGLLTDHLTQLPADQATQVLGRVLDIDDGVLDRVTALVATGSRFAKDHAERGALPAEVWLALGRAVNELYDIGLDLGEHAEALKALGTRPAAAAAPQPVTSSPVVRRRR